MSDVVIAVVVTHRRVSELTLSLEVVSGQTRAPDHLIVVDNDPLGCPLETLRNIKVLRTYVGGKLVFSR